MRVDPVKAVSAASRSGDNKTAIAAMSESSNGIDF
jgi:hypothetical protein